ncbi:MULTISPECIES: tyrosine-type recombinase/integrase [unclassified Bradyrhizobium]|uniref:tyrosine-type recombinase/integrase n=1 Tax=unclassified Bradyrhizobium TaxID=2631580 RepID=UPI0033991CC2
MPSGSASLLDQPQRSLSRPETARGRPACSIAGPGTAEPKPHQRPPGSPSGRRSSPAIQPTSKVHPYMLRHACGFALTNKGHDTRALLAYLGHRNIQHTVRYTELSPTRFKVFWRS